MDTARRNFRIGIVHEALWGFGAAFVVPSTILALALVDLGRSASSTGLFVGLWLAGLGLPQIPSASRLAHRIQTPAQVAWLHSPAILGPLVAAVGFLLLPPSGLGRLVVLSVGFAIQSLGLGVLIPHWVNLMGRCIPEGVQGRYFGTSFFVSGLVGIPAGWWAARLAAQGGASWGYAACFALSVPFSAGSAWLLSRLIPLSPPVLPPPQDLRREFRDLLTLFKGSNTFRLGVAVAIGLIFVNAPSALYTVYLRETQGVAARWFELFNPALSAGSMAGSLALGFVVDRWGARRAMAVTFGVGLLGLAVAAFHPQPPLSALAFVCAGFTIAANTSVLMVWTLRVSGGDHRTLNIGLFNTMLVPWQLLAPWGAGLLAAGHGYGGVFFVSAFSACLALGLLFGASPRVPVAQEGRGE